jgi:hypothetical protein
VIVRQLLHRVLELLEDLVHQRPWDVERGLDAQRLGVEQRASDQDAALEEARRHRITEFGVDELQADEQAQPAHVLPVIRKAPLHAPKLGEQVRAGVLGLAR